MASDFDGRHITPVHSRCQSVTRFLIIALVVVVLRLITGRHAI